MDRAWMEWEEVWETWREGEAVEGGDERETGGEEGAEVRGEGNVRVELQKERSGRWRCREGAGLQEGGEGDREGLKGGGGGGCGGSEGGGGEREDSGPLHLQVVHKHVRLSEGSAPEIFLEDLLHGGCHPVLRGGEGMQGR